MDTSEMEIITQHLHYFKSHIGTHGTEMEFHSAFRFGVLCIYLALEKESENKPVASIKPRNRLCSCPFLWDQAAFPGTGRALGKQELQSHS